MWKLVTAKEDLDFTQMRMLMLTGVGISLRERGGGIVGEKVKMAIETSHEKVVSS
jgi:hypothetical protein